MVNMRCERSSLLPHDEDDACARNGLAWEDASITIYFLVALNVFQCSLTRSSLARRLYGGRMNKCLLKVCVTES